MSTTPKQIKSKSYDVEKKNGFAVDDGVIYYRIDNFDDSGKLVERIWTDKFYRSAEDIIWKYEYDEKGRLMSIKQNCEPEFIEFHSYDIEHNVLNHPNYNLHYMLPLFFSCLCNQILYHCKFHQNHNLYLGKIRIVSHNF